MQSQICGPLGLTGTAVMQGADVGLPFYHEGMGLNVPQILASMGPDGGIVSTLDEVLIFLRAFTEGQLFDLRNIPLMQQWNRLFYPLEYGYISGKHWDLLSAFLGLRSRPFQFRRIGTNMGTEGTLSKHRPLNTPD
ncbi:beta-lactamase family protein [Octadecabacter ascidiaceicola]|uniref:Uncharacterized protein n=1 Tax=Octadecabacter ascidiaceicola TaxID=1655543 RepID=A0A238K9L1_9RHOB|nr:beta-lactamase family protein [Octadecabacter ascidiaceicola]SMX39539.1 hypothetical protein OCA8868_02005 [Octadecabacter ascidiaceicola]